ncbi:MAG TPA: hypothetical protein VNU19_07050 [Candidatus Acidoferrum sp.]|jgi:hypothetical protein|nr:hypothetical protein [Candidatus Acidoferrum sp.]
MAQATSFAKSVQLTVLDQNVFTATNRLTSGRGGLGRQVRQSATVITGTTDASTLFYRMVRVPTIAFITKVAISLEPGTATTTLPTMTTFSINVGMWASDAPSPGDGTSAWMLDYTTLAISDSFFALAYAASALTAATPTDITFQNFAGGGVTDGFYVPSASFYPLWDAVQNGGALRTSVAGYVEQTQGKGYSSSTSAPWTSPANGGTVLPAAGDPGGFVDIGYRNSSTMSVAAALSVTMYVDYILG